MTAQRQNRQAGNYTAGEKLLAALALIIAALLTLTAALALFSRVDAPTAPAAAERKFPNPQLRAL